MTSGKAFDANPHQGRATAKAKEAQQPERQPASAVWRRATLKRAVAKVKESISSMFARAAVPFALLVASIHGANYTIELRGGQNREQGY